MKKTKIGVILLAMVLAGMLVIPAAAVKMTDEVNVQDSLKERVDLFPVNCISIDEEIKNATPYYIILIGNEKEKHNLFRFIDNSSVSEDGKKAMKEYLKNIWEKYPIKRTKEDSESGSITHISFYSDKKGICLTDDENEWLKTIDKAMAEPYNREIIRPRWAGFIHGDIIYEACVKAQFPNPDTARDAADDPDYWSVSGIPSLVPQNLQTAINAVFHSWGHYYSPYWGWGGAPGNAQSYSDVASEKYDQGRYAEAAENLGWASHFITDVSNPMHTGEEIDQYQKYLTGFDIHGLYEGYVSSQWGTNNEGLKKIVHDNNNWYTITSADEATKTVAFWSHRDLDTLYTQVYNYRDDLDSAPDISRITMNNIYKASTYTNGLARLVKA